VPHEQLLLTRCSKKHFLGVHLRVVVSLFEGRFLAFLRERGVFQYCIINYPNHSLSKARVSSGDLFLPVGLSASRSDITRERFKYSERFASRVPQQKCSSAPSHHRRRSNTSRWCTNIVSAPSVLMAVRLRQLGKCEHDFVSSQCSHLLSPVDGTPEQDVPRSVDTISHRATANKSSKQFFTCGCQCLDNFVERLKRYCRGTLETATIVSHPDAYTVVAGVPGTRSSTRSPVIHWTGRVLKGTDKTDLRFWKGTLCPN